MESVVIVTGNYPEPSETFIRRETKALAKALENEFEVVILCAGKTLPCLKTLEGESAFSFPLFQARPPHSYSPAYWFGKCFDPGFGRRAARLLSGKKIRHIHAHFANYPAKTALELSKICGAPFSVSLHAGDVFPRDAAPDPETLERASAFFCCSEFLKTFAIKKFPSVPPEKFVRMYHGLDFDEDPYSLFKPVSEKTTEIMRLGKIIRRWPEQMLAVGRNVEKKGFRILFEALRKLKNPFRLRLLTDANADSFPDAPEWIRQGRVEFHSWVYSPRHVAEHFLESAILVVPSIEDGGGDMDNLPNALIEGMAFGAAIVASRLSGIQEAIETEKSGLLVTPGNADELAGAIDRLLSDDKLRNRLSIAGAKRARALFSIPENIQPLVEQIRAPGER